MASTTLQAVKSGAAAERPKDPAKDLATLLASSGVQAQIKAALPRHLTPERMARIATTEMRKNPKLMQCEPMSFLGAVMQLAQLGLEPGGALGHAYILPFDKRGQVNGQWEVVGTEAQVIIGYRGMIDLARRSGQIVSIESRAVYAGDRFHCTLGLESKLEHVPDWDNPSRTDPEALRFVYAVAKLKDGGVQFDVMSRPELEAIRDRSQGYKTAVANAKKYKKPTIDSPWSTDFAAMAMKTVLRRLFKFLPVSIELQTAVSLDERADLGMDQQNAGLLTGEVLPVEYASDDAPQATGDPGGAIEDSTGEITFTYAQVDERLVKAKTVDELDEAGSLIASVGNRDHAKQLNATYIDRKTKLEGGAS